MFFCSRATAPGPRDSASPRLRYAVHTQVSHRYSSCPAFFPLPVVLSRPFSCLAWPVFVRLLCIFAYFPCCLVCSYLLRFLTTPRLALCVRAALRQGSMIHIWDEQYRKHVEQDFHEAFYTHTSTSPNYQVRATQFAIRMRGILVIRAGGIPLSCMALLSGHITVLTVAKPPCGTSVNRHDHACVFITTCNCTNSCARPGRFLVARTTDSGVAGCGPCSDAARGIPVRQRDGFGGHGMLPCACVALQGTRVARRNPRQAHDCVPFFSGARGSNTFGMQGYP